MNLVNILSRKSNMKRAFVALESDMDDMLKEEFLLPQDPDSLEAIEEQPEDQSQYSQDETVLGADTEEQDQDIAVQAPPDRMTAHAQGRITDIAAFDETRVLVQQQLDTIGTALTKILSVHHLGRDFLDDCYADVRRASDLEQTVSVLSAENGKLDDRLDKLERLRARYDQLIEVLKHREAKLVAETDRIREELASAKLEAVEARSAASRAELAQADMHTALATRTSEADRYMRENELLREKNVNLSLDLDKALQRQAETRRKFEDLSSLHTSETSRIAKISARLAGEEKEASRLQQLADSLERKLMEANETITGFNRDAKEREELYQSEIQALRSENQGLSARIQTGFTDQTETSSAIEALEARLNEAEAARLFAERKMADAVAEMEAERTWRSSQHERQVKELRAQVDELTRTANMQRQKKGSSSGTPEKADIPPARPRRTAPSRGKRTRASA